MMGSITTAPGPLTDFNYSAVGILQISITLLNECYIYIFQVGYFTMKVTCS